MCVLQNNARLSGSLPLLSSASTSEGHKGFDLNVSNLTSEHSDLNSTTSAFVVNSGPCQLDAAGCVVSPHYPKYYQNSETCSITIVNDGYISSTSFETESGASPLSLCFCFSADLTLYKSPTLWLLVTLSLSASLNFSNTME